MKYHLLLRGGKKKPLTAFVISKDSPTSSIPLSQEEQDISSFAYATC